MENGISLYPGLDNTPDENLALLERAAQAGIRRVFTSLHIPETDVAALKQEIGSLLRAARRHHMEVISDVSPATCQLLDLPEFTPTSFRMLGITTLRLDYGFSAEEMARLTHRFPEMRFQLNASTITNRILKDLQDAGTDFSHIDALHNFYPRRGTGLSEPVLVHANILLHRYGIRVGAFVASQGRRRSPLGDGLPTLEEHREIVEAIANGDGRGASKAAEHHMENSEKTLLKAMDIATSRKEKAAKKKKARPTQKDA